MALTNAEKFDTWRKTHLGPEGDRSRLQLYVRSHLGKRLRAHARKQGMTITEAVEHLIKNINTIEWPEAV